MSERKPGYIGASERAERRWKRDAEQVISENFYGVPPTLGRREELVKAIVSEVIQGEIAEHEHEFWRVCVHCGRDDGQVED